MSHSSRIQFLAWALALLAWGPASGAEPILELRPSRTIEFGRQSTTDKAPVISSVSLDPAGTMLATAGDDHLARIWDARDGQLLQCLAGHDDWVRSVAFSPNGQTLATAGADRRINLWKVSAGRPYRTIDDSVEGIFVLVFSPDSRLLAAGGFESKVRIHDGRSGDLLQVLDVPGGDTRAMAFSSPNGGYLAAAGRGGCIRIWSTVSGQQVQDWKGHRLRVNAIAWSPDGKRLASGGDERNILIWDIASGKPVVVLPERPGRITSLTFCGPNRLASGGSDNLIHVWDLPSAKELSRLVGHTGSVTALVWDPSTACILSGSFDTTVRLWSLRPQETPVTARRE